METVMRYGYIREIRLSDQLQSDRLAGFCRVGRIDHKVEVQTAIDDLVRAGQTQDRSFEVELVPQKIGNFGVTRREIDIVMSLSVDVDSRSLVFEFSDAHDGEILDTAALRFSNIRSVMDPYRKIIERSGFCRFNKLDTEGNPDLLRREIHVELVRRMGLNVYPFTEKRLRFSVQFGRYIGNLIYALFPKGPADDWTW
jgi:hypothetical protein